MNTETKTAKIKRYFERMSESDIEGIIAMFASDGFVMSPFLGKVDAPSFFRKLGNASTKSTLTVHDILISGSNNAGAGRFRYDWVLADGSELSFEGVDYFTFNDALEFQSMHIYYDTHPLRMEVGDKYANA